MPAQKEFVVDKSTGRMIGELYNASDWWHLRDIQPEVLAYG